MQSKFVSGFVLSFASDGDAACWLEFPLSLRDDAGRGASQKGGVKVIPTASLNPKP